MRNNANTRIAVERLGYPVSPQGSCWKLVSALQALIAALDVIPHQKRTVVYSAPGDRRNVDLVKQGELLGAHFDRAFLRQGGVADGADHADRLLLR